MPDPTVRALPFSQEENADGARFVWFASCRSGRPYSYTRTADVPKSRWFRVLDPTQASDSVRPGDIAWWPNFMAVAASRSGPLITPEGRIPMATFVTKFGAPRFFRQRVTTAGR